MPIQHNGPIPGKIFGLIFPPKVSDKKYRTGGLGVMDLQSITISVTSLEKSKVFYEEVLGLQPDIFHAPTRWQSYRLEGHGSFGIVEAAGMQRAARSDIINFTVKEIDRLWIRVRDRARVESPLAPTPWGGRKFVIRDPDGFRLGFSSAG